MGVENNIPEGWIEVSVSDIPSTNDESISKDYNHLRIEYLDTGSITKNNIEGFQLFDLKDAPSRAKRLIKNGDIIYSTVRPNQEHYGYITNPKANWVVSTGFCVIRTKSKSYSKFLYHMLTQNKVRDYIHILGEQSASAYPSIKPTDIENLRFNIPIEFKEQKAIAKVLTAFDDKIELLQAQNKTLETMAQTIFKEWFGRYQNGNNLPEGWRIDRLEDVCEIQKGLSYKGKHLVDTGIPMVNLGSVKPGGGYRAEKIKYYNGDFKERHLAVPGDIIIANTDMTYDRVILGSPFMLTKSIGEKVLFTHHLFNVKSNEMLKWYIYYYIKSPIFREMAESCVTGTTVLALPKNDIVNFEVIIPQKKTLNKFNSLVQPLRLKIEHNNSQIQSLTKTRDTLLPKLMSGQVRVNNLEQ